MIRFLKTILILVLALGSIQAQEDTVLLTKNFEFADGIYLSFQSFQENRPDYTWDQLRSNLVANPQTFMAQVEFLEHKESGEAIQLSKVWGMSLGGLPYIRLEDGLVKKPLTNFAAIRARGKICFFEYKDFEEIQVPMPVYNPLTKKPYQVAFVDRKVDVYYSKILDFETGAIEDLTIDNLMAWVQNDAQLVEALESLGEDADDKLFKCILIYDDRHQVYIRKN